MKKYMILFVGLFSILLSIPIIAYLIHFYGHSLSNDTKIWGQFGDFLSGFFTPIIAFSSVIVTLLISLISNKRNKTKLQIDKQNNDTKIQISQQKERPLAYIKLSDFENYMEICMINKGIGPLIISKFTIVCRQSGRLVSESIFAILPPNIEYNNYTGSLNNIVISANETKELFLFTDDNQDFIMNKANVRSALSGYEIVVQYKDVYDNIMPTYRRSLAWFGRHTKLYIHHPRIFPLTPLP